MWNGLPSLIRGCLGSSAPAAGLDPVGGLVVGGVWRRRRCSRRFPGLRGRGRSQAAGAVLLILATCAAAVGQGGGGAAGDRNGMTGGRSGEAGVALQLDGALGSLLQNADQAAVQVASGVSWGFREPGGTAPGGPRGHRRSSALAVYDAVGELVAWDGDTRAPFRPPYVNGTLPTSTVTGPSSDTCTLSRPSRKTGGVAVAALLMRADLPSALGEGLEDFAGIFRQRIGEEIRITPGGSGGGGKRSGISDGRERFSSAWRWSPRPGVSASRSSGSSGGASSWSSWRWGLAPPRGRRPGVRVSGRGRGPSSLAGVILPLGSLLGVPYLFAPAGYLLPGPGEITLGRLLALGCAGICGGGPPLPSGIPPQGGTPDGSPGGGGGVSGYGVPPPGVGRPRTSWRDRWRGGWPSRVYWRWDSPGWPDWPSSAPGSGRVERRYSRGWRPLPQRWCWRVSWERRRGGSSPFRSGLPSSGPSPPPLLRRRWGRWIPGGVRRWPGWWPPPWGPLRPSPGPGGAGGGPDGRGRGPDGVGGDESRSLPGVPPQPPGCRGGLHSSPAAWMALSFWWMHGWGVGWRPRVIPSA